MKILNHVQTINLVSSMPGRIATAWQVDELYGLDFHDSIDRATIYLQKNSGLILVKSSLEGSFFSVTDEGNFFVICFAGGFACYKKINHSSARLVAQAEIPGIQVASFDEKEQTFAFVQSVNGSLFAGIADRNAKILTKTKVETFNPNSPFMKIKSRLAVLGSNLEFDQRHPRYRTQKYGGNGMGDFYLRCPNGILEIRQSLSPKGKGMIFTPDSLKYRLLSSGFAESLSDVSFPTKGFVEDASSTRKWIYISFRDKPNTIEKFEQI